MSNEVTTGVTDDTARAKRDGTRAETIFRLSLKGTSPFKSVGVSVQSTAGSRGVRISLSNAGYTTFGGGERVLATHSIRQFPRHFPSRASPCATRFRTSSTIFMFAPCINSIKNTFIVPTDAYYYKIIEMLKQFKIVILAPACFAPRRNRHQGAVLCLAKTTKWVFLRSSV